MEKEIILICAFLFLSALFSAVEMAFVSVNQLHIGIQSNRSIIERILLSFSRRSNAFLSFILIGNTIALVVYGIFMADILEPSIRSFSTKLFPFLEEFSIEILVLVLQTLLSTILVLAVAEFLPKSFALINPYRLLKVSAIPMKMMYIISYPIVFLVIHLCKFLFNRILRFEYVERKYRFGLVDLQYYIENDSSEENISSRVDKKIFNNALSFKFVKIKECMIPRKEIIAIDIKNDIEILLRTSIESGHSKILIYEDSIDNIIGYCHIHDLFTQPKSIKNICNPIIIMPEAMPVSKLMRHFIQKRKSVALVVDEFGGTSGIVTMEDIIEEIFGEISDEYDSEELVVNRLKDSLYLLSARLEIDILNEEYGFNIPLGDYETLGGYMLAISHSIPHTGEIIENDLFRFKIKKMANVRIDLVEVYIKSLNNEN